MKTAPHRVVGAAVFCIGLASFGVLAWVLRKAMSFDRALDAGDVVVMSVFAIFGSFCVLMAWRLFLSPDSPASFREPAAPAPAPKRVTLSAGCSTAGVILMVLAALVPDYLYPVVLLFVGIALLAVSHALTPCEERIDKLKKMRAKMQL